MGTDNDILNGNGGNEPLMTLQAAICSMAATGTIGGTARLKRYHHWEKRCRLAQRRFAADIIFEEDGNDVLTARGRNVLESGNRTDRFHYNLASERSLAAFRDVVNGFS